MNEPKVSVCVVTYNQQRYIGQAIQSVLDQQTNFPVEIVIGEDCSTDDTRGVLEVLARRHPESIRMLLAERNLGAKQNFMRTFRQCRGQYAIILEGDDYWTCPQKLQLQVDALDARPDWAICFHPAQVIDDDWRKPVSQWPERWDRTEATLADLFLSDFIPTNSALFRNRLFQDFPPWYAEILNGDWALHMLNAAHGNIGFLPQVMSVYRVHARGLWSQMTRGDQLAELLKTLSAVDRHFGGKYSGPIDQCRLNILNAAIDEAAVAKATASRLAGAEAALRRLEQENLKLRRTQWNSMPNTVAREVARPVKQLWNRLRRKSLAALPESRAA